MLFAVGLEALFTFIRTFIDERRVGSVGTFFLAIMIVSGLVTMLLLPAIARTFSKTLFPTSQKKKQVAAAADLNLSFGTYRRYLTLAVQRLCEMLWEAEQSGA